MRRIPPPVLALGAALVQRTLSRYGTAPGVARRGAAAGTAAASIGLASTTAWVFRRTGTTIDPLDPTRASALVTSGPNALTRNPMYVGLAGLLVANAVRRGSWAALLPVAGFVAVIDRSQIAFEEAALRARFGAEYDGYRAAVPRWLGPLRSA